MTDRINLATEDKALLKAAETGEEVVELTPELMKKIGESIKARNEEDAARFPGLIAECHYDTRLAITAQVFEAIVAHMREGGSYRTLIYERLGFGFDAYLPLYNAGGMTISNALQPPDEIPQ